MDSCRKLKDKETKKKLQQTPALVYAVLSSPRSLLGCYCSAFEGKTFFASSQTEAPIDMHVSALGSQCICASIAQFTHNNSPCMQGGMAYQPPRNNRRSKEMPYITLHTYH